MTLFAVSATPSRQIGDLHRALYHSCVCISAHIYGRGTDAKNRHGDVNYVLEGERCLPKLRNYSTRMGKKKNPYGVVFHWESRFDPHRSPFPNQMVVYLGK